MSDIPPEIFPEMLRRSPVESLFRFRSVCKTWRRIIDNSAFSKQHINHGIGQDWFFHRHEKGKLFLLPLNELIYSENKSCKRLDATNVKNIVSPGVPRLRDFQGPVSNCNGLILLSSCNANLVWRIWNPFTGESVEIKQSNCFQDVKYIYGEMPICGIGYDEAKDDYKVVRIFKHYTFMYSLNLKKWRRIEDLPHSYTMPFLGENGVYVYGALHWVTHPWNRRGSGDCVVALDLTTAKYRKIPLPSEIIRHKGGSSLSALSGCLFLSCSLEEHFYVWMIKDYGCEETWIKVVSLKEERLSHIMPVAYLISKEQVLLHSYIKRPELAILNFSTEEYLWYDVGKQCSERLGIEVDGKVDAYGDYCEYIYGSFTSQVFPASLIRLKSSDDSEESVVASQRTSKRKRKRAVATESLPLKIKHGDPENCEFDEPTSSDELTYSDQSMDFLLMREILKSGWTV